MATWVTGGLLLCSREWNSSLNASRDNAPNDCELNISDDVHCRGGFSELGAPGKYRNGALYICTHLPRSTLRFLFCRDACCCTMVPHSCVQCFYIFSCTCYNGILSFTFTFTFIHLADTFILSCCRPWNSNWLPLRYKVLTKKIKNYKTINLTIEPLNHLYF